MAKAGKKPLRASPACFLSTRSYEQAKVDVAYPTLNVKLIGISGGISYGAPGNEPPFGPGFCGHVRDSEYEGSRAEATAIRREKLMEALVQDEKPAYIRVGRNPVEDIYEEGQVPFEMDGRDGCLRGNRYRHDSLWRDGASCETGGRAFEEVTEFQPLFWICNV